MNKTLQAHAIDLVIQLVEKRKSISYNEVHKILDPYIGPYDLNVIIATLDAGGIIETDLIQMKKIKIGG
jgi:hypothetical protein